ncbi:hypothetical protein [Streptomyces griseus]|uniref:hypothetical protein n=1 Tax=Streptomyces griseus TaxID=1911 RepID=UPI0036675A28
MTTDDTEQRTSTAKTPTDPEIRVDVRRQATGLTYEQLGDLIAAEVNEVPQKGGVDRRAAVRMTELRRIRHLLSQQPFAEEYTPAGDPEERWQNPASGGVRPPEQRGLYRVLARCTDPLHPGAFEVTNWADASSVEEAAETVRRAKEGNLYGPPGLYRITEVFENTPATSARHMEEGASRTVAEIGAAATAVAGAYEPAPEDRERFEVLADFFHRTVVYPWHLARPGDPGDGSTPRPKHGGDHGPALARLLMAHLDALDTQVPPTQPPAARPQHDADAYGQELAGISRHQHEATGARSTVFQALAAAGIGHEQADDIVAKVEAGAVAGAHTWISESSAPHRSEPQFEDGWHAGVRDVTAYLLRIADTTATTRRGSAASSAMLLAHLQQQASPAPQETTADEPTPAPVPPLEAKDVLAAVERFPWAVAAPGERHWPDGSDFLDVALSAVGPEERAGYIERLEVFVEEHRARLEELLRTHGPGSTPASHGRYALIGQPETLVILERMEAAPFLLRCKWEEKYEEVFLNDLEFAWGPRVRLNR